MENIIKKLDAKITTKINIIDNRFKIPVYEIKQNDGSFIYLAECDFTTGEDLRPKGIVEFYSAKNNSVVKITQELLLSCSLNIIKVILQTFK